MMKSAVVIVGSKGVCWSRVPRVLQTELQSRGILEGVATHEVSIGDTHTEVDLK